MAILRDRRFPGDRLPCGCFGGRTRRDFRALLARNAALGGLAVVAWRMTPRSWPRSGPAQALPALLVALGLGLAVPLAREARRLTADRP